MIENFLSVPTIQKIWFDDLYERPCYESFTIFERYICTVQQNRVILGQKNVQCPRL